MVVQACVRRPIGLPLSAVLVAATSVAGCLNRPIDPLQPRLTQSSFESVPSGAVEQIDLLLAIDNSISMADKQQILADAVPTLVGRFVNPFCIDPSEQPVAVETIPQPTSVDEDCPIIESGGVQVQTEREFKPVRDIHVGIISSSLGDLGAGTCAGVAHPNDNGMLVHRTAPATEGAPYGNAPTFKDQGFLAWDPDGLQGDPTDLAAFQATFDDMVVGVGQEGCGFEMQLEAVYRFLIDPAPYKSLEKDASGEGTAKNVKAGIDDDLLAQRKDFLRPKSLVAVVMLSDENDCSVLATGANYGVLGGNFERGSDKCSSDGPAHECCYSCSALAPPEGCADGCSGNLDVDHKSLNTVCWDQKRRFGNDFLYPTARYVNAFKEDKIDPDRNDLKPKDPQGGVANPLLEGRPPGLVYFAGIVGVPWQAIARRNSDDTPDLKLGFQTVDELKKARLFEDLVGNPDEHVLPRDPFMIEDVEKRSGSSEILGYGPTDASNPINGGDRTPVGPSESAHMGLQYACTFPIPDDADGPDCDECLDGDCDNPVCNGTVQVRAKAVPGLRQLAVVEGMGGQGVAGSVCPTEQTNKKALDYGYTPAVASIIEVLKGKLQGVQCLDFSLKPIDGAVTCVVLESSEDDACNCDSPGHFTPPADHDVLVDQIQSSQHYAKEHNCMCEVAALKDDALHACQFDKNVEKGVDGWCYLDRTPTNPVGAPELVPPTCGDYEARMLRIVGEGQPASGSTLHIWCAGEQGD